MSTSSSSVPVVMLNTGWPARRTEPGETLTSVTRPETGARMRLVSLVVRSSFAWRCAVWSRASASAIRASLSWRRRISRDSRSSRSRRVVNSPCSARWSACSLRSMTARVTDPFRKELAMVFQTLACRTERLAATAFGLLQTSAPAAPGSCR